MHHLTCGINFLLRSVNLILFTLLLVHFMLRTSPHHSHHLRSHHLSLHRPFTLDLKLISFTNTFLHSLPRSFWTAFSDLGHLLNLQSNVPLTRSPSPIAEPLDLLVTLQYFTERSCELAKEAEASQPVIDICVLFSWLMLPKARQQLHRQRENDC